MAKTDNTSSSKNTTSGSRKKSKRALKLKDISKVNIKEVEEKLIQGRISLLMHQPFFGNMITCLTLVRAEEWCDTAATDGRNFFYNPAFIDSLTNKQVEFLFGHEVLHNVFEHLLRKDYRNHQLWNIAADFCVNQILVENNIGKIISDCLLDPKYKDWSAEQVYEDLDENLGEDGKKLSELLDQMLDQHLLPGLPGTDEGDGNGKYSQMSERERQKLRDEIREAMIAAASQAAGKLPASVKRMVEQLTQPKMNWRELLQQQVQSTLTSNYSYLRPNRKTMPQGIVIPGTIKGDTISVCVAIDSSGSISDTDVKDFLSEINGIMSQYDEYEVRVWSFDTQIYNDTLFTSNDGDIAEYKVMGGGGTSFNANWNYMKEQGIEPKVFIVFTDGMSYDGWGDVDYCDTVWIVKNNPNAKPTHGLMVPFD